MFIKNYTNKDLTFNAKGNHIVLTANQTTTIPDGLITIDELQSMFGVTNVSLNTTGPATSMAATQQVLATGKLYLTDALVGEEVRLFIGIDGSIDVYGSDSKTVPTSFSVMNCPESNEGATGVCSFGSIPRYIALKVNTGTPEITITNCKCYEVGSIS